MQPPRTHPPRSKALDYHSENTHKLIQRLLRRKDSLVKENRELRATVKGLHALLRKQNASLVENSQ